MGYRLFGSIRAERLSDQAARGLKTQMTWILIIYIVAGTSPNSETRGALPALATVPGYQSRYDCELAAKEVNEISGHPLSAVCIDGPKRSDSGQAQGGHQYPDPR